MALTVADRSDDSFRFFKNLSPRFKFCPLGSLFLIEAGITARMTDEGGGPLYGTVPSGLG